MEKIVQTAGRNALKEFSSEFAHFMQGGQILVCVAGRGYYQEEARKR